MKKCLITFIILALVMFLVGCNSGITEMLKTGDYNSKPDLTLVDEYKIPKTNYSVKLPRCSKKETNGDDLILDFETFKIYVITGEMLKGYDPFSYGSSTQTQSYNISKSCHSLLSGFTSKYFNVDEDVQVLSGQYRNGYLFADFWGELDFNNNISGQVFQIGETVFGVVVVREKNETNYENIFYSTNAEGIKKADLMLTIKKN